MTVRPHRVDAFCNWLDTIPPNPPFYTRAEARFFADLTEAEVDAASTEMARRAGSAAIEADFLEGYMDGRDPDTPPPSENRSHAYQHSFAVGRAEKEGAPLPAALSRRAAIHAQQKDADQ